MGNDYDDRSRNDVVVFRAGMRTRQWVEETLQSIPFARTINGVAECHSARERLLDMDNEGRKEGTGRAPGNFCRSAPGRVPEWPD